MGEVMAVEMTILMSAQNAIATESVATYAYFMKARGQFDDENIAWPASCPQAGREPEAGDGAANRRRSVPVPAVPGAGTARARMTWLFTASCTTSAPWMRSLLSRATCVPRWGCTTARLLAHHRLDQCSGFNSCSNASCSRHLPSQKPTPAAASISTEA